MSRERTNGSASDATDPLSEVLDLQWRLIAARLWRAMLSSPDHGRIVLVGVMQVTAGCLGLLAIAAVPPFLIALALALPPWPGWILGELVVLALLGLTH